MPGDLIALANNAAVTYERTTVIALICFGMSSVRAGYKTDKREQLI